MGIALIAKGDQLQHLLAEIVEQSVQTRTSGLDSESCRVWCGRWDSNPHDVAIEGF
jgi:hypothetical protein